MNKKKVDHLSPLDGSILFTRFQQVLVVTQITILFSLCGSIFLNSGQAYSVTNFVLIGLIVGIGVVSYLLKNNHIHLAHGIFVWLIAIGLACLLWSNGGLRDSAALAYPVLLVFAALFGSSGLFLSIFAFVIAITLLLGLNTIYGWHPNPLSIFGFEQVIDSLAITGLSGYTAWIIGNDLKKTLTDLYHENLRVNDSRLVITHMAEHDPLTGLLNRASCEARYLRMLCEINIEKEKIVLFFVDLDNFKNINDSFNHHAGDELLIAIAGRLKSLLRSSDLGCRLGGDEFLLFVKCPDSFDIDSFATQLLTFVTKPHEFWGIEAEITASIGIAVVPKGGLSFDDVRKRADMAMYKAKLSGKNTWFAYNDVLQYEANRKISIFKVLSHALKQDFLDLYFQPKYNLLTGKIEGVEVLLRWTRENPENIQPDEFIPIIESTELIHEIGSWVIRKACKACKRWHDQGFDHIGVAVNVSSIQFSRANFHNVVTDALQQSGLPAISLEIELTEHVLLQSNQIVRQHLQSLKASGVKLAIDDFGTGYSNLSYLTQFKVDVLKLDKSFVSYICDSLDHLAVVTAIIQMAQILGMQVVAEGVENDEEHELLKTLGCDYGQGFLWSKAVSEAHFLQKLTHDVEGQSTGL